MLNICLIERLVEETRFQQLERLLDVVMAKSDAIFAVTFDRTHIQQLIAQAESTGEQNETENVFNLDGLIHKFWEDLEISFLTDYIGQNIVELFHQEIDIFPYFFVSFYKKKIADKLIE